MMSYISSLKGEDVKRIEKLEKEMGKTLLAFSQNEISPAPLDDGELAQIKNLEMKLGVSLVAVN